MLEKHHPVIILGGGLSGLAAGLGLHADFRICEAEERPGGLCRSVSEAGFVFDYGPHILFPKVERARELIGRLLAGNLLSLDREAWIVHQALGAWTRFPFQHHLHGLPPAVVGECLVGAIQAYVEARRRGPEAPPPADYREWIVSSFGEGIARRLMIPYAEKLWTVDPATLGYGWIGDRVPLPEIEEIVAGALAEVGTRYGFNPQFWYPRRGGIEALPRAFLPTVAPRLALGRRAEAIDLQTRVVRFAGGAEVGYDTLVYTLPLPELPRLVGDLPAEVARACAGLQHNSILCVNLGVEREAISDKQWLYFYEDEFPFHRISFPMNLSPETTPRGMSSISTEIAYSAWRPVDRETIVERTVEALRLAGILRRDDRLCAVGVLDMHYAYVLHDLGREERVRTIHRFLRRHRVEPCGRFGLWEYLNMDRAIESGLATADLLNRGAAAGSAAR